MGRRAVARARARTADGGGGGADAPAWPRIDAWASDGDFWVRRSALLALLPGIRSAQPDLARFTRYAEPLLAESEFFIRKAIGWVLREVSKKRPELVYAWLTPRIHRASGVTVREAVKYLPPRQRDELLAAHRDSRPSPTKP